MTIISGDLKVILQMVFLDLVLVTIAWNLTTIRMMPSVFTITRALMITFITSLRHPETANNYIRVEQLFELCARSVCSQTHNDIRFIVVCNQTPNIGFEDPRIQYAEVDFPIPRKLEENPRPTSHKNLDKGLKILLGTWLSLEYSPKYIFIVDADDWLDRHVADYVDEHDEQQGGFVVDRSYMVNLKRMSYKRRRGGASNFGSTICPSLPTMLATFPELLRYRTQPTYQDLIGAFDSRKLIDLIGGHWLAHHWRRKGRAFERFPFFAASWILDNGENNLGSHERSSNCRSINQDFLRRHGLPTDALHNLEDDGKYVRETLAFAKDTSRWILRDLFSPAF